MLHPEKPARNRAVRQEPLAFAYFGLLLFIFVYFARPEDWIPGLAFVPVAKIAGALILVALILSYGKIRWHLPWEIIFLALLILQLWLSVPFSPVWKGGAIDVMLGFSKVLPLVIVIHATVRSLKRLRWIMIVQAASIATVAIASIVQAGRVGERLQGALHSMWGDPNDLAVLIDLSLPLCLAIALTTRDYWQKITWVLAMLAMLYAVMLTASRAGALALGVAVLVCVWHLGVRSRRAWLLLAVPVVLGALWLYAGSALRQRFVHTSVDEGVRSHGTEASESARQRKQLLLRSLEVTAQHPILGVGPGNFVIVSGVWHVTHNSFTQVSAEGGIPAFLLYSLVFWRAIANLRQIRRVRHTRRTFRLFATALEASLAAFLVGSVFLSLAYHLFPYCLVGYTTALLRIVKNERRVSQSTRRVPPKSEPVGAAVGLVGPAS